MRCAKCDHPITTDQKWRSMTPAERAASGVLQHRSRGLCSRCYDKAYRDGSLLDFPRLSNDREYVIEEATFLVEQCAMIYRDLPGALKMQREALNRALKRAARRGDERAVRLRQLNPYAENGAPL